ncbi:MAG: hypothetical protein LBV72_18485 [Tannerella sp.]|jgi:hypothetical protein|nr:hypothetical protein [Tannerella sp.]
MGRFSIFFISLLFVLCGCSQQEEAGNSLLSKTDSADHFYGVKRSGSAADDGVQLRGIAQRRNLWHTGTTIKVRFLNGTDSYHQKIMAYAAEWEQYADIHFQFITEGKADVRIGFDWNDNRWITWSYIGTDCKIVTNQSDATLSFADWGSKPEEEIQGDALRAFGQVLGLELEHRHLSFDPGWTNRIVEYWEIELEDVPWADLKEYVFDPLSASDVVMTQEYDEQSIMVWPFHRRYADSTARYANYELSETDKQFIGQLYPKGGEEVEENLLIRFTHTYIHEFYAGVLQAIRMENLHSDIIIDWGDGTRETFTPEGNYLTHYYEEDGGYEVKIYGAKDAITDFQSSLFDHTEFVVEEGCLIESLDISMHHNFMYDTPDRLENLDLSNALSLTFIDVRFTPLVMPFTDSLRLTNMINLLPQRPTESPGTLYVGVDLYYLYNELSLCTGKNWMVY